jgi:hypothetical protein
MNKTTIILWIMALLSLGIVSAGHYCYQENAFTGNECGAVALSPNVYYWSEPQWMMNTSNTFDENYDSFSFNNVSGLDSGTSYTSVFSTVYKTPRHATNATYTIYGFGRLDGNLKINRNYSMNDVGCFNAFPGNISFPSVPVRQWGDGLPYSTGRDIQWACTGSGGYFTGMDSSRLYEEGMLWYIDCDESWQDIGTDSGCLTNNTQYIYHVFNDTNDCGTKLSLPVTNGTLVTTSCRNYYTGGDIAPITTDILVSAGIGFKLWIPLIIIVFALLLLAVAYGAIRHGKMRW